MMDSVYYFIRELPKSRIKRIYRLEDGFAGNLYPKPLRISKVTITMQTNAKTGTNTKASVKLHRYLKRDIYFVSILFTLFLKASDG